MDIDKQKYDRQIRLFGEEVQLKLSKLKVQVIGTSNYASLEIIKNLTLLGIGTLVVQKKMLEDIKKIVPDNLEEINTHLNIEISESLVNCDFRFVVNQIKDLEGNILNPSIHAIQYYFICTTCKYFKFNDFEHECIESEADISELFLLGALVVQEFLKILQGKKSLSQFKVDL